jgi:hypothetical protein
MIRTPRSKGRIAQGATALALLVGISACATGPKPPSFPAPDEPGIYSFTSNKDLRRLDGDADYEADTWPQRSNLSSNVQFVVNDPALVGKPPGTAIELWRVAWVRSDINANNQAMPTSSQWAVAPLAPFSVPFRYESPASQPQLVHVTPTTPLPARPLHVAHSGRAAGADRIAWNGTDQRQYSAANCVDRYVAQGNAYRECAGMVAAQPTVAASTGNAAFYNPGAGATNAGLTSLNCAGGGAHRYAAITHSPSRCSLSLASPSRRSQSRPSPCRLPSRHPA